ncbi:hypothetical protein ACLOJK_007581 [Asimina triloba]
MEMELRRKIEWPKEVAARSGTERRRETDREVANRDNVRKGGRTRMIDGAREGGGCEIGNRESARKIGRETKVAARLGKREQGKDHAGEGGARHILPVPTTTRRFCEKRWVRAERPLCRADR